MEKNKCELLTKKAGSLPRLRVLFGKLKRKPLLFDQCKKNYSWSFGTIAERIPNGQPTKREFYIPYRLVILELAESIKLNELFQ